MLKRVALIAGVIAVALAAVAAAAVFGVSRHELASLRAAEAKAKPLSPVVKAALLANDPALIAKADFSLRALIPSTRKVARCAPTTAFLVVRNVTPRMRSLHWHVKTTIATAIVTYAFTPDQLLRIYAHDAYFGKVGGVQVYGVEPASAAYFRKRSGDLTPAEAAMLVGILPSPNRLSPFQHPARAMERRDRVLTQMLRRGHINEREFRIAIAEPLPSMPGA